MQTITEHATIQKALDQSGYQSFFSFDLTPYIYLIRFSAGEQIFREGGVTRNLYYLIEGQVKICRTHSNGSATLIELPKAPSFIGEMELLGVLSETLSVTALTPCRCLVLPVEQCRELLLGDVVFLNRLCVFLGKKSHIQTSALVKNLAYPLKNRLANFILMTAKDGVYREKHTETAEYLGVAYRHLLYVLADFCKAGILQKLPRGYGIADMDTLQALAQVLE